MMNNPPLPKAQQITHKYTHLATQELGTLKRKCKRHRDNPLVQKFTLLKILS